MTAILAAWESEPETVDERTYTKWAEPGWSSWNGYAAESEFCQLAAALATMTNGLVIETGTGAGFTSRRVAEALKLTRGTLTCWESDQYIRERLGTLPFFSDDGPAMLADAPTPLAEEFAEASLVILDSDLEYRFREIKLYGEVARPGSILLVHDCANGHLEDSVWMQLRKAVEDTGMRGALLQNPRGAYLIVK
jgi:hypothetical protein